MGAGLCTPRQGSAAAWSPRGPVIAGERVAAGSGTSIAEETARQGPAQGVRCWHRHRPWQTVSPCAALAVLSACAVGFSLPWGLWERFPLETVIWALAQSGTQGSRPASGGCSCLRVPRQGGRGLVAEGEPQGA